MSNAINDLARLILAQMTGSDVDRATQASIDRAMVGAISDVRRGNPNQLNTPVKAVPLGAGAAPGWKEEAPLPHHSGSHADRVVDEMTSRYVGGPNEPVK